MKKSASFEKIIAIMGFGKITPTIEQMIDDYLNDEGDEKKVKEEDIFIESEYTKNTWTNKKYITKYFT